MVDFILFVAVIGIFCGGVYVGATYGGLKALVGKAREAVKAKL